MNKEFTDYQLGVLQEAFDILADKGIKEAEIWPTQVILVDTADQQMCLKR